MKCRLLTRIGMRYSCGYYWEDQTGYHRVEIDISKEQFDNEGLELLRTTFTPDKCVCDCHKTPVPADAKIFCSGRHLYDSEDGKADHPGDMIYAPWMHHIENGEVKCMYWDNCKDPRGHLLVVLPTGAPFDTDARASNCNKPNDRLHRCWEKHGEPPNVTVGGPSSDNGVGSIGAVNWHGYLTNGVLHN